MRFALSPDDLKTVVSIAALALSFASLMLSFVSLLFTRKNWLQSNRPIVTAFITIDTAGNTGTTFNLVIANTGNRPAVQVRMEASQAAIVQLLDPPVLGKNFNGIESNFLKESTIPLLRNGEELTTAFGAYANRTGDIGARLRYGAETEITIKYQDLDGRKFVSQQPLKVYAREGFGGSVWEKV